MNQLAERLFQPSTVKGVALIGAAFGLNAEPTLTIAGALIGLIDIFRDEHKTK